MKIRRLGSTVIHYADAQWTTRTIHALPVPYQSPMTRVAYTLCGAKLPNADKRVVVIDALTPANCTKCNRERERMLAIVSSARN